MDESQMTIREHQAYKAVIDEWIEWHEDRRESPPQLDEAQRIASSFGLVNANQIAEDASRKALMVYLGKGWGVGPEATIMDRIVVWFAIRKDMLKALVFGR